jgi:hypothetical protein
VIVGGTADAPVMHTDRTYMAAYEMTWLAIVHGPDQDEAELQASIYGVALTQMVDQQGAAWHDEDAYIGPALDVESLDWIDTDWSAELPQTRRRTLAPAAVTFRCVFRNAATSRNPEIDPPTAPEDDPGDFPEIVATELQIERESIA